MDSTSNHCAFRLNFHREGKLVCYNIENQTFIVRFVMFLCDWSICYCCL